MHIAGTQQTPRAGAAAEAEALIQEARARARRRRRKIAVTVVCAAVLVTGAMAAARVFPGSRSAGPGNEAGGAGAALTGAPPHFLDATQSGSAYGWLEIRDSATGKVVAQPPFGANLRGSDPPYSMAATGPGSFVVGMMRPDDCTTQFFRLRIDDEGRPGPLTHFGPILPGELTALAASAGGGLVGYSIDDSGCNKSATSPGGYLGVLDVHSGQTRQWTGVLSLSPLRSPISQLSMSANGRLLAFAQATGRPAHGGGMMITGTQVRMLPTDALPGTVAERSRVVARTAANETATGGTTVVLSPSGTSFYLCSQPLNLSQQSAKRIVETARVVAYQTATGKATHVLATLSTSFILPRGGSYYDPMLGCSSMALDTSGRFLLVPYQESRLDLSDSYSGGSLRAAIINTGTGARSTWTLPFGENKAPGTMTIAW